MEKRKAEVYRKRLLEKQDELLRLVSKSDQDGREADEEGTQDIADKAANAYTKEFLFHQSNDNRLALRARRASLRARPTTRKKPESETRSKSQRQ